MKRVFIFLVILALPAMLFAVGQQEPGGNYIRFAWWGNPTRDERTNQIVDMFMARNPGTVVELETVGWGDYWPRMATLAAAQDLPDVMQHDTSVILQHSRANLLVDLTPFVQRGLINLQHWPDAALGAGRFDNRLYGLVLGTNAWGIGGVNTHLQAAGVTIDDSTWTWADYERIAVQIFQRTGVQTHPPYEFRQPLEHISRQFGVPLFSADERSLGITGNQAAINAYAAWIDTYHRINQAGALFNIDDGFIPGITMAEGPLFRGQVWNSNHWSNQHIAHSASSGREMSYFMLPTVQGARAPFGLYMRASMYISMTSHARNRDLAARFIDFFINDIEANRVLMAERGVPIPTNVRQDLYPRVDANNRYIFDYITKITPFSSPSDPPAPARAIEVEDMLRPILHAGLNARTPGLQIVNQMIQTANGILTRP